MTGVGVPDLLWGCLGTALLILRVAHINHQYPIRKQRVGTVVHLRRSSQRGAE